MTSPTGNDDPNALEMPWISHLVELRARILRSVLAWLLIFAVLAFYANPIYSLLAEPLKAHLPEGGKIVAIGVASPFMTPLKLAAAASLLLAVPYILFQAWGFIAPGLYQHEKRLVLPLLLASTVLFYSGVAFAYFAVFPLIFGFLAMTAPEGVTVMTDINHYFDFVVTLFLAFGVAFEVPVATLLLIWAGIVPLASMIAARPYVIVAAFAIGAILTPPDPVSQTMMAVPVWLLFEIGLLCARWVRPRT
ncbi:MAG: Sec-independent protein translocase TatC [Pseudomonadota bacterium]